jgi:hypothetical protein
MCLHKKIGDFHKIAEEPITCYKIMWYDTTSTDEVRVNSSFYPANDWYRIGDKITARGGKWLSNIEKCDLHIHLNGEVVHSFKHVKHIDFMPDEHVYDLVVVKCEIPKGEYYWEGTDGDGNPCYGSLSLEIKEVYTKFWELIRNVNGIYWFTMMIPQFKFTLDDIMPMAKSPGFKYSELYDFDIKTKERKLIYSNAQKITEDGKEILRETVRKMNELLNND